MRLICFFITRSVALSFFLILHTDFFGQSVNDYRSVQTGNWNNSATWERYDGSAWVALTAYPVVGSTNSSAQSTAATTHVVALPTGIQSGDLLLIFWVDASTSNTNPTIPAGWTEIGNDDVGNRYRAVWYKVADGTEGATINVTGGNEKSAHNSYRIVSGSYSGVPVSAVPSNGNNNSPNPPGTTSGFGTVNTLWIASAHSAGDGSAISNPANYTNQVTGYSGTAGDADSRMVTARRTLNAATEDPGSFTGYSANRRWAAFTVAIQPTFPVSSGNVITVRNTHTVTVATNITADQVIIDAGGQVTINSGQTLTVANGTGTDLAVDGTIVNSGTITTTGTVQFNASGVYQHTRNGGAIPAATWNATSLCSISGITGTAPTGINQTFGHFTWDCIGQTTGFLFAGALTTINGNFTVGNTNTFGLYLASTTGTTYTLAVAGDLIINDNAWLAVTLGDNITATINVGGNFTMSGAGAGTTFFDMHPLTGGTVTLNKIIVNVAGNFSQSGGQFDFAAGDSDAANFTELRVGGNFSFTGPAVMGTSSSDNSISNGTITFNKSGTQAFTAATPANLVYTNFIVASGSTLELLSNVSLTSEATPVWGGNFTVNTGGILDAGTSQVVSSTGASAGSNNRFTLSSGAGLVTANVNGVQNTTIGTISTSLATRTYSSSANYTYDGVAIQNSGIFTTSPTANQVNNLVINNSAGNTTNGVTLEQPLGVAGTLTLSNGHITSSSTNLLTLNAGSSVAGANYATRISGGSDNSFVNGPVRKVGNTDFLFPVGKVNAGHHFAGISAPANPGDTYTGEYMRASARLLGTVSAPGLSHVSNCEYWNITTTAASPDVNVTLSWNGNSNCNAAVYVNDLATLVVAHFGATWDDFDNDGGNTGTVSAGSVTWNNVTTFSPFALGSTDDETNPLPVKFVNVKAYASGAGNKIEWANLTESAIDKYEVERSVNGISFTTVMAVAARSNSSAREEYAVLDNTVSGSSWYRIRAKGLDGSSVYSAVVRVSRTDKDDSKLVLYPNPVVSKQMTIQLYSVRSENYTVSIFNNTGQAVYTTNWIHAGGSASRSIEIPAALSAGTYHIQVKGNGKTLTSTFVIQ